MREVTEPVVEPVVDPITGEPVPEPTEPVEDDDNGSDEEGERYDGGDIPPAS